MLTVTIEGRPEVEPDIHLHAGSQGVWIASMLATLGIEVRLCGPFGGESGLLLRPLIQRAGIDLCEVAIGSGNGAYVHDRRGGERREIATAAPPALNRHELDDLCNRAVVEGLDADVVVLSGPDNDRVLAADVYRRMAADLTRNGQRVVVDLAGPYLDEAAAGRATVVKASHEDLIEDGRARGPEPAELVRLMSALAVSGAGTVVVTRAAEPTLALTGQQLLEVYAPVFEQVDHRGAGDSMTAGIAAGLARGEDIESALRLGAAAATLNVSRHGLASGKSSLIERLTERVGVQPIERDRLCER